MRRVGLEEHVITEKSARCENTRTEKNMEAKHYGRMMRVGEK